MRKPLLLLLSGFAFMTGYAQSRNNDSVSFKPQAKNIVTELNVNPFNGNISLNNSLNQIKVRYFTRPDFAWRLGFNASTDGSLTDNNQPYGTNSYRYKNDKNSTTLGINLGIEKHLPGTPKLSPYIGFDLTLTNKSLDQEIIQNQNTTKIKGAWMETVSSGSNYYQTVTENGFLRYGAALVTGFDFYLARNFFLGYELNFGFEKTDYQDVEITLNNVSANNTIADTKNTKTSLGPRLMNGIRIGYIIK